MDRQDPPNWPRYQLTSGLDRFRHKSRQEESMISNAQYLTGPAGGNTRRLFLLFGGPVCADRISKCPLGRILTCKN